MSAIDLEISLRMLSQCYIEVNEDGGYVIDPSLLGDNLAFQVAMSRIVIALKNKEMDESEVIYRIVNNDFDLVH